ncbi:DNA -binding domain-containing protein [Candidatus Rariloculus sp.]|uniref:DNA -binding domain-containing protein n=1 Tax=Candidatus Rariloculus sp. TaxID=3101265 RepID=UPI003D0B31AA
MGSYGGPRGWAFLRRNPAYRAAWRARFGNPEFEAGTFPVRIQSKADRRVLEWGLLAREDPHGTDGPASPFWAEAPMLDGEWATGPPSLLEFLARSGARLEGLRLADGSLILKIENGSQAVQVRIGPGADTGMGMALVVSVRVGQAQAMGRLRALASVAGKPGPHPRRDRSGTDHELLTVLDGRLAGKSWREAAVDLYGAKRVAAEWNTDGWMRSRVRRLGRRAHRLMEGGYRDLVAKR